MRLRRRHILESAAAAFAIVALAAPVHAQGYPSKPIRMVVGFPPGGGMDLSARVYLAPEQLVAMIKADIAKYGAIVKGANIR